MSAGTWAPEFANPYKVYVASIVQAGSAAPTPTVSENTIGSIVWARTGAGVVTATLTGAFTANKTYMIGSSPNSNVAAVRTSANVITFTNTVDGVATDGFTASVQIIVKA